MIGLVFRILIRFWYVHGVGLVGTIELVVVRPSKRILKPLAVTLALKWARYPSGFV